MGIEKERYKGNCNCMNQVKKKQQLIIVTVYENTIPFVLK